MTPDTLKTWRARLGLGEHGMAAYVGVPLFTWRKWENGTRTPDAAPLRLLALLQMIENLDDGGVFHAELMRQAREAENKPTGAPKRRGKGKGAASTETRASGAPDAPAAPPPCTHAADALPDWMKSSAAPA